MEFEDFLSKYNLTEDQANEYTKALLSDLIVVKITWMNRTVEDWDVYFENVQFGDQQRSDWWSIVDKEKVIAILN